MFLIHYPHFAINVKFSMPTNHYTPRAYPINLNNPALPGLGGYLAAVWLLTALFAAIQLWYRQDAVGSYWGGF